MLAMLQVYRTPNIFETSQLVLMKPQNMKEFKSLILLFAGMLMVNNPLFNVQQA